MMGDHLIVKNARIYGEGQMFENGFIEIRGQKIVRVGDVNALPEDFNTPVIRLNSNLHLIPGFIDIHIHGANGSDTMDATEQAVLAMVEALPKEGTTSFLLTTITQENQAIETALQNAARYIQNQGRISGAEVLGVHLEGPFISAEKAGAQPVNYMKKPDSKLLEHWQSIADGAIKVVTMAPELSGGMELIQQIRKQGAIASIGHSNASYEIVQHAIQRGAEHVTHLYNQMSGLHHREPGVVGGALLHDELFAEIIADGIHVHPDVIRFTHLQKTSSRLILVTDSIRAKGLNNGTYDLGGQKVTVKNREARLSDGTLAGSVLKMNQAANHMMRYTGCSMEDIITMASVNPAKQLKLDHRKGSIAPGKDADFVIVNDEFEVLMTFCRGRCVFRKEGVSKNGNH